MFLGGVDQRSVFAACKHGETRRGQAVVVLDGSSVDAGGASTGMLCFHPSCSCLVGEAKRGVEPLAMHEPCADKPQSIHTARGQQDIHEVSNGMWVWLLQCRTLLAPSRRSLLDISSPTPNQRRE